MISEQSIPFNASTTRSRFLLGFVPMCRMTGRLFFVFLTNSIVGLKALCITIILFFAKGISFESSILVNSEITVMRFTINAGSQNQSNLTYKRFRGLLICTADCTSWTVKTVFRPSPNAM